MKFKVGDRVKFGDLGGTVNGTDDADLTVLNVRVLWDDRPRSEWMEPDYLALIEPAYEYEPTNIGMRDGITCDMRMAPDMERLYRRVPKHVHDYKRVCSCGETES